MVGGSYSRLIGDAGDSPVIETEDQFTGTLVLTYTLN
jgi:outer membrane scaffolding protein for murein synthesis (MipA/OmpV family)